MDYHNYQDFDHPWDDGVYGTGPTQPPKSRGGLVALLLILVIFLCGIVTVLGILNVRLFAQLKTLEEPKLAIAVVDESQVTMETEPVAPVQEDVPVPAEGRTRINLQESPQSIDNFPQGMGLPLQEIYLKNISSVVSLSCTTRGGSATGTGVILSEDGYIVTNAHVVSGASAVTVQLTDNRVFDASLVGTDEISDLAVLVIDAEGLVPAQFGDSASLRVGDTVTAIGDPLGSEFRGTFTDGIVSAINRDMVVDGRVMTLIQTNAALNSGNSGGPLINCFGQVIGINTMKIGDNMSIAGVEGLGFAIPSVTVKSIVDQLIAQGYVSGRPYLGIQGEEVSQLYQYYYRLPEGLFLTKVVSGSDAQRKGLTEGDILISLDGRQITGPEDLTTVLSGHKVGDQIEAVIFRNNHQYAVTLTVEEAKG
jgi:serine protease Do